MGMDRESWKGGYELHTIEKKKDTTRGDKTPPRNEGETNNNHKPKNREIVSDRTDKKNTETVERKKTEAKTVKIETWNITSLTGQQYEITKEMEESGIQAMGIGKTKKAGHGKINLYGKYELYYSGVQQG
ncbi:hypothetical protein ILUMI_00285 [Ignelater luminosus]|uniref:Uncharacterized protein n=1 Tax=Ignelater luminosus TaxID=2038154 RepID=A0A8K0GIK1_IGNLU|nr:hypothetical protein ILUMI_00285 [Ignelater luminosus]